MSTILITGCSTGIGLHLAQSLQAEGHQVIASCRKAADVERLRNQGLNAVLLDVSESASLQAGFEAAMQMTGGKLDVLINNAGYGQAGALEDIPRSALRAQFETNVFGLMELTALAIPIMRAQGQGRIINISSLLGYVSMPFRGAYNASKYAVEGLSDTLRLELKSSGIAVISIQPGPIESEFRNNAVDKSLQQVRMEGSYFARQYQAMLTSYKAKKANSSLTQSPAAVLKQVRKAIHSAHPRPHYPVTFPAHLFAWLKRLLPVRALDWILRRISKQELS